MGTYIALAAPTGLFAIGLKRELRQSDVERAVLGSVVALYVGKAPGIDPVAYVLSNGKTVWAKDIEIMTIDEINSSDDVSWSVRGVEV